jgi:hypothetical protein
MIALGKYKERVMPVQDDFNGFFKNLIILLYIFVSVPDTVNRHNIQIGKQSPPEFSREDVGAGQKNGLRPCAAYHGQCVNQGILVIGCQDDRLVFWDQVSVVQLEFPVVDPETQFDIP